MAEKDVSEEIERICRDVLSPLVRSDGGVLYVVSHTSEELHLHLAGTCAGCPGATMTRDRLMEPAVSAVSPKTKLKVTTGWRVPEGARRVDG